MSDREEADELIQHLLSFAGTMMEDAVGRMIVAGREPASARAEMLVTLAHDLRALSEAARVVERQADAPSLMRKD